MFTYVTFHQVSRMVVEANGRPAGDTGKMMWWQTIRLFGSKQEQLGEITLHLADPGAALPIGDQPPYFGTDPRVVALEVGEVAPF